MEDDKYDSKHNMKVFQVFCEKSNRPLSIASWVKMAMALKPMQVRSPAIPVGMDWGGY